MPGRVRKGASRHGGSPKPTKHIVLFRHGTEVVRHLAPGASAMMGRRAGSRHAASFRGFAPGATFKPGTWTFMDLFV